MKKLLLFVALAVIAALSLGNLCLAHTEQTDQVKTSTPALSPRQAQAQAAIRVGDIAAKNNGWREAIGDYRHAIELDPANAEAHKKFLNANYSSVSSPTVKVTKKRKAKKLTNQEHEKQEKAAKEKSDRASAKLTKNLLRTYDDWIKKNPRQALFYWAKGEVFENSDKSAEALALYHKAIQIDPSCAPAYASLGDAAAVDGNVAKQREYEEQALALDPKGSSDAFFNYALTYLTTDPGKFSTLVQERAAKFPGEENLLYLLGMAAENEAVVRKQETIYEEIYKDYGPKSSHPSSDIDDVMLDLFDLFAKRDPGKALSFAEQMQNDTPSEGQAKEKAAAKPEESNRKKGGLWVTLGDYEKSLIGARTLLDEKKYADALALLDKHKLKPKDEFDPLSDVSLTPCELERAEALAGSGKVQAAYDSLKTALVEKPNARLEAALAKDGARLGKSTGEVEQEVWAAREAKAKLMTPFDLRQYITNEQVRLADFRGHVALVNFWFPG